MVLNHIRNDKEEVQRVEVISPHSLAEEVTKQESFSETGSGPGVHTEAGGGLVWQLHRSAAA